MKQESPGHGSEIVPIIAVGIIIFVGIVATILACGYYFFYPRNSQGLTQSVATSAEKYRVISTEESLTLSYHGKCGLVITSPRTDEIVSFPLTVRGTLSMVKSETGCTWQNWEGVAGNAFAVTSTANQPSSKTITAPKLITLGYANSAKAEFEVLIPEPNADLAPGTLIEIVFEEENPAVKRPNLTYRLPLIKE